MKSDREFCLDLLTTAALLLVLGLVMLSLLG